MKKRPFFRFFTLKYLPIKSVPLSPFFEQSRSQHFFLAGLRCPSGQLQIVAIPLSFSQTGTAALLEVS